MMKEKKISQVEEGYTRRWFEDSYFDLVVWFKESSITEFQLSYDTDGYERTLYWNIKEGFKHDAVDDGANPGRIKMSPIFVANGIFDKNIIAEKFKTESLEIDKTVSDFVYQKITEFNPL